jgi:predicted MFS family arabinose efflux permease
VGRAEGWLTLFVMGTGLFVVSPLLPSIASELAISEGRAGWTVTAFAVGYLLGGPRLGSLADRHGPRPVLAAALGVFAIANLATGFAPNLASMLLCRAVAGLAASGVTPSVYAMVGAGAPQGRRATWLGVITSGLLVALAAGAPIGALLSSAIGWRGVFAGVGGVSAVVLAIGLHRAYGRRAVRAGPPRRTSADRITGRLGLARLRAVSLTGLWAFAVYGLYTYLGVGLDENPHASPTVVAVTLAGYGAGAVAGNVVGGVLADRFGGLRVTVASLAGLAALEVVLGNAVHRTPILLVIVAVLFALAAYPYFTAHQVRLLAGFPEATAAVLAWNNTALYGGIMLGSAVGAQLLARTSFPVLASVLAAAALIGALAAAWAIPAPLRASPPVPAGSPASHGPGCSNRCPPGP